MFNGRVSLRHSNGAVERRQPQSDEDYRNVLVGEFRLNLSEDDLRSVLAMVRGQVTQAQPHPFFA